MSAHRSDFLTLKINAKACAEMQFDRPISVMVASNQSMAATKAADKIMKACRENVRFLNEHLDKYRDYLELPPLVDNVLYLAYTIRVKANPNFSASEFRRYLTSCQIETQDRFSFHNEAPEVITRQEISVNTLPDNTMNTFCIACHQNLTILDMQSIARRIDSFFISKLPESTD